MILTCNFDKISLAKDRIRIKSGFVFNRNNLKEYPLKILSPSAFR